MKNQLFFWGVVLLFLNCNKENHHLERALLEAGHNRMELEKVLSHYQRDDKDSEKYEAACFLIENMVGKFSYQGDIYDHFLGFIDSINNTRGDFDTWRIAIDSFYSIHGTLVGYPDKVFDLTYIKSDFLIRNIDHAFFVYRNAAWCSDVTFDDFCEYILPYRYGNEPLEDFRTKVLKRFGHLIQDKAISARQVADSVLKVTSKQEIQITTFPSFVPSFSFSDLSNIKGGTCDEVTALAVAIMRSLGLCVAQDFTPQWPHRAMGHSWAALVLPDGQTIDFEGANTLKVGGHLRSPSFRMAKAYRKSYRNMEPLIRSGKSEVIPNFFLNPNIKDVTTEYLDKIDIVVDIPERYGSKVNNAYICVFDNKNWVPIHWGRIRDGQVTFSDMGRQVVYLPVVYLGGKSVPISSPLLLDSNGRMMKIEPDKNFLEAVYLKRKYPVFDWWNTRTKALKGGRFQVANNPNFSDAKDIYIIDSIPDMTYQEVSITLQASYKYFRYLAPDSTQGDIAEIELYGENGLSLRGTVIGTNETGAKNGAERVFDGEPLTYFQGLDFYNNWVGLAFSKPEKIEKLRFLCRNDDNFIKLGELYELFYWNGVEWESLGLRKGDTNKFLHFDRVPRGSLLLLRNHTKGKEERPFTYEREQQVWW